tara:strand:+ start:47 stop:229 length:183 start_codon:yes stop_codon:yes gene_type:complete
MKIDLTKKQCQDIEWSILIAIHSVEVQRKKEKKDLDSPLTRKLFKLHDYIQKAREKEVLN